MKINFNYDTSVAQAPDPTAFKNAVQYVSNLYQSIFTNEVTININIGFGEINNYVMPKNSVGASLPSAYVGKYRYSDVQDALVAHRVSAESLPSVDPTNGQGIQMNLAEARALGLLIPDDAPAVDGYIGISNAQSFYYGTTGSPAAGQYDLVATLEHELSEIMGRSNGGGGQ